MNVVVIILMVLSLGFSVFVFVGIKVLNERVNDLIIETEQRFQNHERYQEATRKKVDVARERIQQLEVKKLPIGWEKHVNDHLRKKLRKIAIFL